MPILAQGNQLTQQVAFNAGTFDVNGYDLATLQDITITLNWTVKEIRQLGSIIMAVSPKRSTFKPSAKAKTKSVNKEMLSFILGSSAPDSSGVAYTTYDGQVALTRASIRTYVNDDPSKEIEFQFSDAILGGAFSTALKMEDAAEIDFEIYARDVKIVTNF
jgi:hypothetical protein